MKNRKRRTKLINPKIQFKYLSLIVLAMLLSAVTTLGAMYYLIWSALDQGIVSPGRNLAPLMVIFRHLGVSLIVCYVILTALLLGWGLLLSNRIVGPLARLEKDIDKIYKGDFSVRIRFRKGDELHAIASGLNKVLDKIEKEKQQV